MYAVCLWRQIAASTYDHLPLSVQQVGRRPQGNQDQQLDHCRRLGRCGRFGGGGGWRFHINELFQLPGHDHHF